MNPTLISRGQIIVYITVRSLGTAPVIQSRAGIPLCPMGRRPPLNQSILWNVYNVNLLFLHVMHLGTIKGVG